MAGSRSYTGASHDGVQYAELELPEVLDEQPR
jgi:hypothetical protein